MNLDELYEELLEISDILMGDIVFDGITIKWEYDCYNKEFQYETEEEHLNNIFHDDIEIINDSIDISNFNISTATIEDTIISFYFE